MLLTKTKSLALCAILAAIGVVLVMLASVLPTCRLALTAVASLLPAVAMIHCGYAWSAMTYGTTGILALLLAPTKACAVLFVLVLGYHGITKAVAERGNRVVEWIIKLAVFNAAVTVLYLLFRAIFLELIPSNLVLAGLYVAMNVVFVIYDFVFSGLMAVYQKRIGGRIH